MPQAKDVIHYQDLIDGILYPALERPKKITCLTRGDAVSLRMRLFSAIRALRKQSAQVLDPSHPRHGRSDFDNIVISIDGVSLIVRPGDGSLVAASLNVTIEDLIPEESND